MLNFVRYLHSYAKLKHHYILILAILTLVSLIPGYPLNCMSAQANPARDMATAIDSLAGVKPEDKQPVADTSRFKKERVDLDHVVNFSAKDSIVMYGKNNARMFGSGDIT